MKTLALVLALATLASATQLCAPGTVRVDVLDQLVDKSKNCVHDGSGSTFLHTVLGTGTFSLKCVDDANNRLTPVQPSVCPGRLEDCVDGIKSSSHLPSHGPVLLMDTTCTKLEIGYERAYPSQFSHSFSAATMRVHRSPCSQYEGIGLHNRGYNDQGHQISSYPGASNCAHWKEEDSVILTANPVRTDPNVKRKLEVSLMGRGDEDAGSIGWMISQFAVCIPFGQPLPNFDRQTEEETKEAEDDTDSWSWFDWL